MKTGDAKNATALAEWTNEDVASIISIIFEGEGVEGAGRWAGTRMPADMKKQEMEAVRATLGVMIRDSKSNRKANDQAKASTSGTGHTPKKQKQKAAANHCEYEEAGCPVYLCVSVNSRAMPTTTFKCQGDHFLSVDDHTAFENHDEAKITGELFWAYDNQNSKWATAENTKLLVFYMRVQVYWDMTASETEKRQIQTYKRQLLPNNDIVSLRLVRAGQPSPQLRRSIQQDRWRHERDTAGWRDSVDHDRSAGSREWATTENTKLLVFQMRVQVYWDMTASDNEKRQVSSVQAAPPSRQQPPHHAAGAADETQPVERALLITP
ncbi:uncharacterized protein LTR77_001687 [Saxophila tyrrhenica]|uniref:Uncharacterized protein n=1 Tax=Saxophila tyrrhenica TaxID=1690608 RepID=A0AAV9PNW4_9PEZI|nr:hypothetical protein LTR77_001687 [Saxophila tyrrhenica]